MTITAGTIITNRVRVLLRDTDPGGVLFPDAELLSWLDDACCEINRLRPESFSTTADVALVPGARQTLPSDGFMLLEVLCNVNPTNSEVGRIIRRVERDSIDAESPTWMFSNPTATVYRYVASLTDPRTFHVYPPSTGGAGIGVRLVYARHPAPIATLESNFPLPDMYAPAAVNYVCYRANAKMVESPAATERAREYLAIFDSQMQLSDAVMEGRNSKARHTIGGNA